MKNGYEVREALPFISKIESHDPQSLHLMTPRKCNFYEYTHDIRRDVISEQISIFVGLNSAPKKLPQKRFGSIKRPVLLRLNPVWYILRSCFALENS